ncbi:MAG: hypothetical protein RIQ41_400 [Candidatus Parcubacteria bacterium]|jgi:hypothetical protein
MTFTPQQFTIKNYIRYLRHQHKNIQHIHAFVFASVVTGALAGIVLYSSYGFWHERYSASQQEEDSIVSQMPSPTESFSSFWQEAAKRIEGIGKASSGLLEGSAEYKKEE